MERAEIWRKLLCRRYVFALLFDVLHAISRRIVRNFADRFLQALESGSPSLSARLFLLLTTSFAGLANPAVTASEAERTRYLKTATRWAERGRESKLPERRTHQSFIRTMLTFPAVSARISDFSAQRTALIMKATLFAELGDDAGVGEAEGMEEQLTEAREELLSSR